MNILMRFTLKTMKTYRKWSIVTIIGVLLSTALLTSVCLLVLSTVELLKEQELLYSGKWTVAFHNVERSDIDYWESLEPGDQASAIKEFGFAKLMGSRNKGKPYVQVSEFNDTAFANFHIQLVEGRLPVSETEIILPMEIKTTSGRDVSIGDVLRLELGTRKLPNGEYILDNSFFQETFYDFIDSENAGENVTYQELGPEILEYRETRTYTVVGFMETPIGEDSWSAGFRGITAPPDDAGVFRPVSDRVTLYFWSEAPSFFYYDSINELASQKMYVTNNIEFNARYLKLIGATSSFDWIGSQTIAIGFLISIILISSFFLIFNSFSIFVAERRRHLGLMATAGATRKQKMAYIFFEMLLVGLIGIPLGLGAGFLGTQLLFYLAEPTFLAVGEWNEMKLRIIFSPALIVLIIVFEFLTLYFSVLIPAEKASRIMPLDAIRQVDLLKGVTKVRKSSAVFMKTFGIEAVLAMKSFRRNSRRYRATTISLIIGVILFLSTASVLEIYNSEENMWSADQSADITYSVDGITDKELEKLYERIGALPDVQEIAEIKSSYLQLFIDQSMLTDQTREYLTQWPYIGLSLLSCNDEYFRSYAASLGEDPGKYFDTDNPAGILLNYADEYDYNTQKHLEGDILVIKDGTTLDAAFYSSDVYSDGKEIDEWEDIPIEDQVHLRAEHITTIRPLGCDYTSFSYVYLIVPETQYLAILEGSNEYEQALSYSPTFYIRSENSTSVEMSLREFNKTIPSSQFYLINQAHEMEKQRQGIFLAQLLVYGFISLISLISLANLFNTITTSTALRQKEYAMLRSVGMSQKQFYRMVRLESLFIGTRVLLIGLPISFVINLITFHFNYLPRLTPEMFPWMSYLATVLLIFSLIFLTMMYSISKINKQNIIDALKSDTD